MKQLINNTDTLDIEEIPEFRKYYKHIKMSDLLKYGEEYYNHIQFPSIQYIDGSVESPILKSNGVYVFKDINRNKIVYIGKTNESFWSRMITKQYSHVNCMMDTQRAIKVDDNNDMTRGSELAKDKYDYINRYINDIIIELYPYIPDDIITEFEKYMITKYNPICNYDYIKQNKCDLSTCENSVRNLIKSYYADSIIDEISVNDDSNSILSLCKDEGVKVDYCNSIGLVKFAETQSKLIIGSEFQNDNSKIIQKYNLTKINGTKLFYLIPNKNLISFLKEFNWCNRVPIKDKKYSLEYSKIVKLSNDKLNRMNKYLDFKNNCRFVSLRTRNIEY